MKRYKRKLQIKLQKFFICPVINFFVPLLSDISPLFKYTETECFSRIDIDSGVD